MIDPNYIDMLTPKYRKMLDALKPQERKVLYVCAFEDQPFTATHIGGCARIFQTNHVHAVLHRLMKKGHLLRLGRSLYGLAGMELQLYVQARKTGNCNYGLTKRICKDSERRMWDKRH